MNGVCVVKVFSLRNKKVNCMLDTFQNFEKDLLDVFKTFCVRITTVKLTSTYFKSFSLSELAKMR